MLHSLQALASNKHSTSYLSKTLTAMGSLLLSSTSLSGAHALREIHWSERACEHVQAAAGGPVPHARGKVVRDGDRDGRRRRHAHAVQAPRVPGQHMHAAARLQVPHPAQGRASQALLS